MRREFKCFKYLVTIHKLVIKVITLRSWFTAHDSCLSFFQLNWVRDSGYSVQILQV